MKQYLSGKDWLVSPFYPDEAGAHYSIVSKVTNGNLYGAEFIPALVPGDVQSDAMDAGMIDDINIGYNARKAEWTYQRDWMYVRRFTPEAVDCKKILLCLDGVDYACDVFLNGQWLGYHEIAWIPFSYDITDKIKKNEENCLIVLVKAAPWAEGQGGACSKVRHLKSRFAYGWDFATRLVPLGIWRDVYIHYQQDTAIMDLHLASETDYRDQRATIRATVTVSDSVENCPAEFTLTYPNGKTETARAVISGTEAVVEFDIVNAALWYPNGMGEQPLYNVTVSIGDGWDSRSVNTGLRCIEWRHTEGAGMDAMAYQPWVNGRRMFIQGYNWVPIHQLYGREHKRSYSKRIELARRAGFNFIRVWGGGILEREQFYDLCDRSGILVMQELFQSSGSMNNHPPRDPEYIEMLLSAVTSAVIQKRNHPSLAIWCGGNELCFRGEYMDADGNILIEGVEDWEDRKYTVKSYPWVPVSAKYPTLAAMEKVIRKLDPGRAWWHTSGSGPVIQNADLNYLGGDLHDVHGPWEIMGQAEFYNMYNKLDMMAHMEFGCPGAASVQTIETIIPEQYRWPLDPNNPMANCHGRNWTVNLAPLSKLEAYFGQLKDHREYAVSSRFIQWEQLRYALEAHRRLGKKCAGACLWCMSETWPYVMETCSIDAFDQAKPAYYGEKTAFRTLHIAPKYESVIHGDSVSLDMTLYNSTVSDFAGRIHIQSFDLGGQLLEEFTAPCSAKADDVVEKAASFCFTKLPKGIVFLRYALLDSDGNVVDRSYIIKSADTVPFEKLIHQDTCPVRAKLDGNCLTLKNEGTQVISALTLESDNQSYVFFSDGCMMLLPDEEVTVQVDFEDGRQVPLYISGFGVPYHALNI